MQARYADAKALEERALAIDEAAYGPDHPKVATRLNNLALTLQALGQPEAARPLQEYKNAPWPSTRPQDLPGLHRRARRKTHDRNGNAFCHRIRPNPDLPVLRPTRPPVPSTPARHVVLKRASTCLAWPHTRAAQVPHTHHTRGCRDEWDKPIPADQCRRLRIEWTTGL